MIANKVTIRRLFTSAEGTPGLVFINREFFCFAMELPWRDNKRNVSCIPTGKYLCTWHRSPRFGWTYIVNDVNGRSFILFHSGNVAGDVSLGFKTHSNGCLLLGKRLGSLFNQLATLISKPMINKFIQKMGKEPFELEVVDGIF